MALMMLAVNVFGQETAELTGKIVSEEETLVGANVIAVHSESGKQYGTITDVNGAFKISNMKTGAYKLTVSFVGYVQQEQEISLASGTKDIGTLNLKSDAIGLVEVSVLASVAVDRKTPVAISTIKPALIEEKLGSQEFPEVLKSTPGVYATRQGGGFGDSRINVRGFDMRNTAVMINGIPVNDMENGWVYWSNWAGLSEVTRTMQVQRGLGASKLSIGSVGGTINILTKTTDAEKGGTIYSGIGSNGYKKTSVSLSTGLLDNGMAVTFAGARTTGDGWADATQFESWSYFLNVAKRWSNQSLSFTIFGAPQTHGQRRTKEKIEKLSNPNYGIKFNADWGYKNGQKLNLNTNFYHKPQMSLNHYIDFSQKTKLATSAYMSFGTGGGTGSYGETAKFGDPEEGSPYRKEGLIDYDLIVQENIDNGDGGSTAILRASRNDHNWYGLLSNLNHKLTEELELSAGIDLRYYQGKHFREVVDLLGGNFYLDAGRDQNNPDKLAKVGDKINYHNVGEVAWQGVFLQTEYSKDAISAFISGSVSNTGYRRIDYFNYLDSDPEQTSDWETHLGYVVKGGVNYNIDRNHNVFANAGYFERAPDFDGVFYDYSSNNVNEGAKNEKTLGFEVGYGFRSTTFSANINGYYTNWQDKSLRRSLFDSRTQETYQFNIEGVDALHMGVELDFVWKPINKLEITGMASIGDWKWQNDLQDVRLYNDNNEFLDSLDIYMKDLRVGDAAQTTFALGANYELFKGFKIGLDYNYFDNLYAQFDPAGRSGETNMNGPDSWKLPAYALLRANLRYKFKIANLNAKVYCNINNLLNTEYITDADDGSAHDWETSRVFYGTGRTWTTGIKIYF